MDSTSNSFVKHLTQENKALSTFDHFFSEANLSDKQRESWKLVYTLVLFDLSKQIRDLNQKQIDRDELNPIFLSTIDIAMSFALNLLFCSMYANNRETLLADLEFIYHHSNNANAYKDTGIYKKAIPCAFSAANAMNELQTRNFHLFSRDEKVQDAVLCLFFDSLKEKEPSLFDWESETSKNQFETIEHLTAVLPQHHIIPNNKLANIITKIEADIEQFTLEVSKKGAKKTIETTVVFSYDSDNIKLTGRKPFTGYDRSVYNGVSSLYVCGDQNHVYTPAQIYRAMVHADDTENPSPQQIASVTKSLDKMRFIRARIDCTAELQARRLTLNSQQINGGEIDTYLLAAEVVKVKAGGKTVTAYRIIKPPILYEYAAALNQVLTLPASLLNIKMIDAQGNLSSRSMPNTEQRIVIRDYLLQRIEGMKGNNGLNNHVIALYDYQRDGVTHNGLYAIAGKPDANKIEAKRIRADIEKMLAYWKNIEYIKNFDTQADARGRITNYKITI